MKIHQFVSSFHTSNTFVVELNNDRVALIDCCDTDLSSIKNWLLENRKVIQVVFLTHEHADHCAGVNACEDAFNFELICTKSCATNIRNSKQNLSFYMDSIATFEVHKKPRIVSDETIQVINGQPFVFVETPGHSPGSACIFFGNAVFTGDTLLNGIKTPLTFPHSNRKLYADSVNKIMDWLKPGMTIYPGHGEPFIFNSIRDLAI
jgi:glyoxylase-like metal-dependent hydrolase (beta-lactamase superfamily II)